MQNKVDTALDSEQTDLNKKAGIKTFISSMLSFAGLAVLVILFTICTDGLFAGISNLSNLISQGFTIVLVSAGASFIYARGNIDMSLGAVLGLTQIVSGLALSRLGIPGWMGLLIAVFVGVACTSITSVICSVLSVPSFVASLCVMNICNGIISWVVEDGDVYITYSLFEQWDSPVLKGFTLLLVLVIGAFLFYRTRVGKDAKALGGNEMASIISGIRKVRATWLCYIVLGVCIGLAGFFGLIRSCRVSGGSSTLAINILTAVVLGGFPLTGGAKARFVSAIVGAVTVSVLDNGLTLMGLDPAAMLVLKGVLFLIVVSLSAERGRGMLVK